MADITELSDRDFKTARITYVQGLKGIQEHMSRKMKTIKQK